MAVDKKYIDELKAAVKTREEAEAAEKARQDAIEAKRNKPKIVVVLAQGGRFSAFRQFGRRY